MGNPTRRCADARSLLFVPGNRSHLFKKAMRSGADALILDLEDSVPATDKVAARMAIETAWSDMKTLGVPLVVRINAANSDAGDADLAWLAHLSSPAAVMLPKVESARTLVQAHERLPGTPLMPLIESAAGLDALPALAAARGVLRLVVGHIDFMADTGMQRDESETELAPLRFAVAMATRLNSLAPAIDGVTVQIDDDARLRADTRRGLRFGFGGKLCIHPRQVHAVHEALAPSEEELDWARRVIAADAASCGGAVQLDGRMIDLPVVLQARRMLSRAVSEGKQP